MLAKFFSNHWFEFLWAMTVKEVTTRYKHTFLGFLWVILNPLFQMMVIGLVFQFFVPKVDNYFLFLFTGLLPWSFFSLTLGKSTNVIVYERLLIRKAQFPREALVLSIGLAHLFHFLISLVLLLLVLFADKVFLERYDSWQLGIYSLRLLLTLGAALWLMMFTNGLSLWTAAINVKYRDINFFVQALLPLWFYLTPIVYPLKALPAHYQMISYLNPMTGIVEFFQWILLQSPPANFQLWLANLALTPLCLVIGWYIFGKEKPYFDDWL